MSGIVSLVVQDPTQAAPQRHRITLKAKGVDALRLQQTPLTLRLVVGDDIGAQTLPCSINRARTSLICEG